MQDLQDYALTGFIFGSLFAVGTFVGVNFFGELTHMPADRIKMYANYLPIGVLICSVCIMIIGGQISINRRRRG